MWTVVFIASNKDQAESLKRSLENEDIMVKIKTAGNVGSSAADDFSATAFDKPINIDYEVLVLESELDEALELINSIRN